MKQIVSSIMLASGLTGLLVINTACGSDSKGSSPAPAAPPVVAATSSSQDVDAKLAELYTIENELFRFGISLNEFQGRTTERLKSSNNDQLNGYKARLQRYVQVATEFQPLLDNPTVVIKNGDDKGALRSRLETRSLVAQTLIIRIDQEISYNGTGPSPRERNGRIPNYTPRGQIPYEVAYLNSYQHLVDIAKQDNPRTRRDDDRVRNRLAYEIEKMSQAERRELSNRTRRVLRINQIDADFEKSRMGRVHPSTQADIEILEAINEAVLFVIHHRGVEIRR